MILIDNTWFIGKKLNMNVYSKQGSLLLPRECILNKHHIDLLHQHDIEIWREDTELVTEFVVEETVSEVQSIFEKIHNQSDQISNRLIQRKVVPKIQELCSNHSFSTVLLGLTKKDNYTYRHSIGVGFLSYLLGKWLALKDVDLKDLVIAGLLHDLGKIKIPNSILTKRNSLTADEYAEMKLHTYLGYDMVRNLPEMTERQALVALQHHERMDGSGYPYGIFSEKITYFSKIVAVVDVFHTMTSERVYKKPIPVYQVFQEIYQHSIGLFDPKIVRCFVHNLMDKLIGDHVLLTDGSVARIIMIHLDDLINPLVESRGHFIDLRQSVNNIVDFARSE